MTYTDPSWADYSDLGVYVDAKSIVVHVWSSHDAYLEAAVSYDVPEYWDELTDEEKQQALSDIAGTARVNP